MDHGKGAQGSVCVGLIASSVFCLQSSASTSGIVRSLQNHLRRFLRLTTAACVLPYNGLRRKISVVCLPSSEALPVGHTCSIQLDLPDYNNSDKLKQKMDLALAHVDDPFGYA